MEELWQCKSIATPGSQRPQRSPPCRCQEKHRTPTPRSSPHPHPVLAPPLRLDLVRLLSSSSFLPSFPPQQAKVRKKTAHLQNSRRPVWKKLTRQPAVQESLAAGACLGVSTERGTVGRKRSTGPRWGAWASPLATTVAMP